MNGTADDQYMQFYHQQPLIDGMEGFFDATVVTTGPPMSSSEAFLSPKGNPFKQIRKRSRASKRTPITLLNANTNNFRALVQKFTGCPNTISAMSLATIHKGPITLNFQQQGNKEMAPVPLPLEKQPPQQLAIVPNKQQLMQEHQSQIGNYSLDHVKSSNFLPILGNFRSAAGMEVSDGLAMDSDFSLHELSMNSFSNVLCDENNVFKGFNYAITP